MDTTITTIEMCAGYGGIGLGLKNIFGDRMRTLAYCELEGFAQANLISKMETGLMDVAPLWNDLKTFPYESFHGLVDILIAGYPCQPFSAAGKRAGKEDPRHLWPFIASGIRILRPRMCFFENVEGHISLGLREVIGELESMGYKVSWGIFSAREIGAPHQRKRVFIMAHLKCEGLERLYKWYTPSEQTQLVGADSGASCQRSAWEGCELANTLCNGSGEGWLIRQGADGAESVSNGESWGAWPSRPGEPQHGWEPPRVVDSASARQQTQRDESNGQRREGLACESSELGNAASQRPQERPQRCNHSPIQATECGSGSESNGQAQSALGGDIDGPAGGLGYAELQVSCDNRTDELRLLGNGVVPATAERAFRTLLNELNT